MAAGGLRAPKTFIDLFAGVGGFHHALADMGLTCELAVELDDHCRSVYSQAFPSLDPARLRRDIRELTRTSPDPLAEELPPAQIRRRVPQHDVLCAGFPCQPFSKSGQQLGLRDRTRGTLFFDLMSIIIARKPDYVILENVRNIAGPRHQDTWRTVVESLQRAGYEVSRDPAIYSPHLLRAAEGGAPQSRDRVFIVGRRREGPAIVDAWDGPPMAKRVGSAGWDPGCWDLTAFLDRDVASEYDLTSPELTWLEAWQAFAEGIPDEIPGHPIWVDHFHIDGTWPTSTPPWKIDFIEKNARFYKEHREFLDRWLRRRWGPDQITVRDFPASRRKFEWQARRAQAPGRRDLAKLVVQMRPSGIRVKGPDYLPALVAITQTSIVGPEIGGGRWRRITPREAARLQGMPFEPFELARVPDKAIYKQLGNAVNVGVVKHVAGVLFSSAVSDSARPRLVS